MMHSADHQVSMSIRARELDGIRGWAAVMVILYHIFVESLVVLYPQFCGYELKPSTRLREILIHAARRG